MEDKLYKAIKFFRGRADELPLEEYKKWNLKFCDYVEEFMNEVLVNNAKNIFGVQEKGGVKSS